MAIESNTAIFGIAKAAHRVSKLVSFLEKLRTLENNWDGDDAKAPDSQAISDAVLFARWLERNFPTLPVEQACPGPRGEVVIELRKPSRSMEFIFYPAKKWKYVLVGKDVQPEQGTFDFNSFPHLLKQFNEA